MIAKEYHPSYSSILPDWILVDDCYVGERRVKSKRTTYLPYTSGHIADGVTHPDQLGYKSYEAYLTRARFPNFMREAVQTTVGMMHHNDPVIELPPELEPLRERATTHGETLEELLRKINMHQVWKGRIGLLLDVDPLRNLPIVACYEAESIINWDDGARDELVGQSLNLVVLNESENVREGFAWTFKEKYRVLTLSDPASNQSTGAYGSLVVDEFQPFSTTALTYPSIRGKRLQQIPFIFVNSADLNPEVDQPPLLDLANLCITIYRGEADYRQSLFMQGQDTLVIVGAEGAYEDGKPVRSGAGSVIMVPPGGDAKFIGVDSAGLSEQRLSLEKDNIRAGSMGAQSFDTVSRERESGSSLRTRISARTSNLNQIADAGARGLEELLKIAAVWLDADPSLVKVTPNKDFGDVPLTGQEMVNYITASNLGYPISLQSLHKLVREKKLTDMTLEQEMEKITEEGRAELLRKAVMDGRPNDRAPIQRENSEETR